MKSILQKIIMHYKQVTLVNTSFRFVISRTFKSRIGQKCLNFHNITRYGRDAPRYGEIIWIYPHKIGKVLPGELVKQASASVINSDYFSREALSLNEFMKTTYYKEKHWLNKDVNPNSPNYKSIISIACCIDHWLHGMSWEETGIYEYIEKVIEHRHKPIDGCISRSDIIERYSLLDSIFEQVKKEGRFRFPEEIIISRHKGSHFGRVHLGPYSEIYYDGQSNHRFAMAYILQLPLPAQIGVVHKNAIPLLYKYRSKP